MNKVDLQTRIGLGQCYYECCRNYLSDYEDFARKWIWKPGTTIRFKSSIIDRSRLEEPIFNYVQAADILLENQDKTILTVIHHDLEHFIENP